jgi:hypothetical protein
VIPAQLVQQGTAAGDAAAEDGAEFDPFYVEDDDYDETVTDTSWNRKRVGPNRCGLLPGRTVSRRRRPPAVRHERGFAPSSPGAPRRSSAQADRAGRGTYQRLRVQDCRLSPDMEMRTVPAFAS